MYINVYFIYDNIEIIFKWIFRDLNSIYITYERLIRNAFTYINVFQTLFLPDPEKSIR